MSAQKETGENGNSQSVLHHGEDRELIDGEEADVRLQLEFLQDPVNVAAWRVLRRDKGSAAEFFHRNGIVFLQGMSLGEDGEQLIVHDRQKLVMVPLLMAQKTDIHPALLDPVGEVVLRPLDDLEDNVRVAFLEFLDDLRDPVDGAA